MLIITRVSEEEKPLHAVPDWLSWDVTVGRALVAAVTSGSKRFFLGTDSAPHERHAKEASCGCAGIFSAPIALPLYAEAFEQVLT